LVGVSGPRSWRSRCSKAEYGFEWNDGLAHVT
jgi:hypothetical protein